jgi:ABC-type glutathione transport system ATPase component
VTAAQQPALRVRDLDVVYTARGGGGTVHAVRGVSIDVRPGEVVGILGESGCGKTSLARAVIGLVQPHAGTIEVGAGPERPDRLGRPVQMVFQDPRTSLDPSMRVADIVAEPLVRAAARARSLRSRLVTAALAEVGLDESALRRYPRHFSGGQQQRIAIARGLVAEPDLLVCDEIVSALDVSTQGTILNLLRRIVDDRATAMLFISHDVAVLGHLCDTLVVMRDGVVVESGPTREVLERPTEAFTKTLVDAVPTLPSADPDHLPDPRPPAGPRPERNDG